MTMQTTVRGIRGAITVEKDTAEEIFAATRTLLEEIIRYNSLQPDGVASVILTMTPDLMADFPAKAVRSLTGWEWVPLMCATEVNVPGGMQKCIRVLLHVNTTRTQREMIHVYLGNAVQLRPDMAGVENTSNVSGRVDE